MADGVLTLRAPSGVSGDMLVAGLARMLDLDGNAFDEALSRIGLPELAGAAALIPKSLNHISGWGLRVDLPHAHEHNRLADIRAIIERSALSEAAKDLSLAAFALLAEAEGAVHGVSPEEVVFHEAGALDSILDMCLASELFARLSPATFICGPLPVCDGKISCRHGLLASPAPATLFLLQGVPIYGIPSAGETVTPTAIALLRAFGASFGHWPPMVLRREARVYGTRVLPGVPNGAIFAIGDAHPEEFTLVYGNCQD